MDLLDYMGGAWSCIRPLWAATWIRPTHHQFPKSRFILILYMWHIDLKMVAWRPKGRKSHLLGEERLNIIYFSKIVFHVI
jgi:hypothetical protein